MTVASDFNFTRILDTRTDADSPITEELVQDIQSNTFHNNALVRSDGTAVYTGVIDSDPTDASSSNVIDAGPTAGSIANCKVNMLYEVTDGNAQGTIGTINQIASGSDRLTVNTNLFDAGMRSGDGYRIIYGLATDKAHDHDGTNSPQVTAANISGLTFFTPASDATAHVGPVSFNGKSAVWTDLDVSSAGGGGVPSGCVGIAYYVELEVATTGDRIAEFALRDDGETDAEQTFYATVDTADYSSGAIIGYLAIVKVTSNQIEYYQNEPSGSTGQVNLTMKLAGYIQ